MTRVITQTRHDGTQHLHYSTDEIWNHKTSIRIMTVIKIMPQDTHTHPQTHREFTVVCMLLASPDESSNALVELSISGQLERLQSAAEHSNETRHKRKQLDNCRLRRVFNLIVDLTYQPHQAVNHINHHNTHTDAH